MSIELDTITHLFPHCNKPALEKVSFKIKAGQIFSLLGPNGAGKTTLVRILATLILPTGGTARVCGHNVVHDPVNARRCIGLCTDSQRTFYYRLTGYQNLEFFGGLMGIPRNRLRKQIETVIERVGLTESHNVLFMRYSHGMRKKLSLARSLLADPPVYLLDEPTSGLDPLSTVAIRQIISDLRAKGKTILLTTHNMDEAGRMSDRVGMLKGGKLVALDTPANLKQILDQRQLFILLSQSRSALSGTSEVDDGAVHKLVTRLHKLSSVKDVRQNCRQIELDVAHASPITSILRTIVESGAPIDTLCEQETTLEDLFIHIARS